MIKEYFANSEFNIEFADTGEEATKSQRLMQVKDLVGDTFLVAYGDDVSDVNIKQVIENHQKHGKIVTLTALPLYSQFGVLEMNDNNEVINFKEKPRLNHWFNGGFFVFNKQIFDYLGKGELENEVFEFLAKENQIVAHKHDGFWKCMNTFKDTQELNELWAKDDAPWKIWD